MVDPLGLRRPVDDERRDDRHDERRRVAAVTHPGPAARIVSCSDRLRRCAFAALLMAMTGGAVAAPSSGATPADQCHVPDETALIDASLPRLARRLAGREPVTVVVIGSGSAAGSGTTGRTAAFPQRLETLLTKAYPRAAIRFVVLARTGQTAPEMRARFPREVLPSKPALVIWQTGVADVTNGVSVTDFESSLEHGIAELQGKGSDVLLMDGQFSPRASLMINTDAYRDAVRWNARRYDLPLFKRYDTMQYWWNNGVFDLDAQDKSGQVDTADRIHGCVAMLLMRAIAHGVEGPRS